jgi:hypothetical protein
MQPWWNHWLQTSQQIMSTSVWAGVLVPSSTPVGLCAPVLPTLQMHCVSFVADDAPSLLFLLVRVPCVVASWSFDSGLPGFPALSSIAACLLAEICRGWLFYLAGLTSSKASSACLSTGPSVSICRLLLIDKVCLILTILIFTQ